MTSASGGREVRETRYRASAKIFMDGANEPVRQIEDARSPLRTDSCGEAMASIGEQERNLIWVATHVAAAT